MTVVRSICYGYLGAILGGLAVAVVAAPFGVSVETVASAAAPTGIVFGLLGLVLSWRHTAAATKRAAQGARARRR